MTTKQLEALGLTEEQIKTIFAENGKDILKEQEKVTKITAELEALKTTLEKTEAGLKAFEGVDVASMKVEKDKLIKELETEKTNNKVKLEEIEFDNLINSSLVTEKFTSDYAKKGVIADLKAKGLKLDNGSILGLADALEQIRTTATGAFVVEDKNPNKLLDLPPMGGGGETKSIMQVTQEAMGIKSK